MGQVPVPWPVLTDDAGTQNKYLIADIKKAGLPL